MLLAILMTRQAVAFRHLIFLLIFSPALVNGQSNLVYDIHWFGKVGKLSINQIVSNDTIIITINSEVKVPFYKFNWVTTTCQKNEKLCSSTYSQLLNDQIKEFTNIQQTNAGKWMLTNDLGKKEEIIISHEFLVSMLYFKEPLNEKWVFSERFGQGLSIINLGDGHYKLMLPDDNYCEYVYKNGVCTEVKAKNGSRTIKMTLSQQS